MVIGNKIDLEEEGRVVEIEQAEAYCKKNGNMSFLETSARESKNVEKAFYEIARLALKRQKEL